MGGWDTQLLLKLDKHSIGVGCLYIKRLTDENTVVLKKLIVKSVQTATQQQKIAAENSLKKPATAKDAPKVTVQNINKPAYSAKVDAASYMAMKKAMLKIVPKKLPGLTAGEIAAAVVPHLPEDLFPGGAAAGWWSKCVQLDLEAKGMLLRDGGKPLRWRRR